MVRNVVEQFIHEHRVERFNDLKRKFEEHKSSSHNGLVKPGCRSCDDFQKQISKGQ